MSAEAWITLLVIGCVVVTMIREWLPPAAAVLGGSIVLLVTGVIDAAGAFSGFSNPAPITIAALYIVAAAVTRTGLLRAPLTTVLDRAKGPRGALARLLPAVAGGSSVFNNTPIVAMLVPEVTNWAVRRRFSPSRFLMPLSFAAIAGGTITVIGTSTNLVVSGLLEARTGEPLGFFTVTPVGLAIAATVVSFLVLFSGYLLPSTRTPAETLDDIKAFSTEMTVTPGGALDGTSIEAGGLRRLSGMYLVEIERGDRVIAPVRPDRVLAGGDRLRFVGKAGEVVDLMDMPGLESAHAEHIGGFNLVKSDFFEAVIGPSSPLAGSTLKDTGFRTRYQGAVVAIHRDGAPVDAKLGEVILRPADTLVVLADSGFRSRERDRRDFLLVAPIGQPTVTDTRHRASVAVITFGLLVAAASGLMPILNASLVAALLLVALRTLTPAQARDAVDLNVVLLVAGSFGLAAAMESSGLATRIADELVTGLSGFGTVVVLIGIVIATLILTELISNAAAAVVVFPIAYATAIRLGVDPVGFAVAVAMAASTSFLTPVGYQTNMMVFGPGGYRYRDYLRLGAPLTAVCIVIIVTMVSMIWL